MGISAATASDVVDWRNSIRSSHAIPFPIEDIDAAPGALLDEFKPDELAIAPARQAIGQPQANRL
jgi:hypothetical protein